MRKVLILLLFTGLLSLSAQSSLSQEEKKDVKKEVTAEIPKKPLPPYDPTGRRDPFRDLFAGREVQEEAAVEDVPQMSIDDVVLIGIVKSRGIFSAIINSPKGFPFTIKANDEFSDGFVLSINETKVVFRKTKERGIILLKPKDIIKEITLEEC